MRSPFPGVDPYLEDQRHWRDFHSKFINCWQDTLLEKLPNRYDARLNEDVYIGRLPEDEVRKLVVPDVALSAGPKRRKPRDEGGGVAVEEEVALKPVIIPHVVIEERKIFYIEVREKPGDRLVAVLELLSPTNKAGSGRAKYLKKRRELRKARVHLVEVDLLIVGQPPQLAMALPAAHHHILLTRGEKPRNCEVSSWDLQDPLPTIPIPLLSPDPDLKSNLRTVFNLAYERGQYPRAIDYARPLSLAVDEATLQWANEIASRFVAKR